MTSCETIIHLSASAFSEREKTLVEYGPLMASTFLFESGVCGLRLKSDVGQLVLLPFQGQQVWLAEFEGRNLTMTSMFDEPRPTRQFLETYGAFLLHCGITAMGGPSAEDTHPLHGELPNAPYQAAHVILGQDEQGAYIGMGGQYQHTVAFSDNYLAQPRVLLHAASTVLDVAMTVTNLKRSDMTLMYLAHVNFRPVDGGRLVYSAPYTPEHVRVRTSIPSHISPPAGYVAFIEELARDPEKHHVLASDLMFDPEAVFYIDYVADEEGWAHSLHVHPDGKADYVRHRPDQLDKGIRWISRTPDQDALGLVEPATAEPEGYLAEKAKGNLKVIPPGEQFQCQLKVGALKPQEARAVEEKIARMMDRKEHIRNG